MNEDDQADTKEEVPFYPIINLLNLHTNHKRICLYRPLNIARVPGTLSECAVSYNGN
jgi:hypothetical protein